MSQYGKSLRVREVAMDLHKKRSEEQAKRKKNLANNADIQVIGANCQGFAPVLLVNSEGNSYMFNCHEGFQRFCFSNRVKLVNLENVFVTNLDWRRISGLFGLSLTMQDLGALRLSITSGEGINDLFKASSFITYITGIKCSTRTHRTGTFSDNGIQIIPIPIDSTNPNQTSVKGEQDAPAKCSRKPVKLIAYACELADKLGALNPEKCRELKIPIGPILGVLKSGRDATLPDGRVIKSSEVCEPKSPGPKFIVIECPDKEHIDAVVANETLNSFRNARLPDSEREVSLVVHFSPPNVMQNQAYKNWMDGFPGSCKHLSLSEPDPNTRVNFVEVLRFQYLLRKLDDKIFPKLHLTDEFEARSITERVASDMETAEGTLVGTIDDEDDEKVVAYHYKGKLGDLDRIYKPASMDKICLRPHDQVESPGAKIMIDYLYNEAKIHPEFDERLAELKEMQKSLKEAEDYEPELVFLGTGSAVPSKLRNTSCILLNFSYPKPYSVIMDCGDDSYGQLVRHFGETRASEILKQLRMIYVSHQHADHHVGLITLLRERYKWTKEPLALLIPPNLEPLLNYHNDNFEDISASYSLFSTKTLKISPNLRDKKHLLTLATQFEIKRLMDTLGDILEDFDVVHVEHCVNSCGVMFRFKVGHEKMDTFSVAYSGDARPSQDLATVGRNCDLLIHEATFDHKSYEDAVTKRHCTCNEAIEVSRTMMAKFTILTHFSQRLPKIPYFTDMFDDKIGFAFDNLALRCPSHFPRLPIMKPMLRLVFEKALLDIDLRSDKLQVRSKLAQHVISKARSESSEN